jgi:outer membrane protein assembly factor BamA
MAWNRWLLTVILVVAHAASLAANCIKNQDHRSNKNSGVVVSEFLISGTQTLSSDQLNRFRAKLIGACFDDDEKEVQEQVRALFQNAGYFEASLKSLRVKPVDPLGVPKPVALEADVQEGRLFRLGEIRFSGNHAVSSAKLRGVFPLRKGDLFAREKIAGGLDALRILYGKFGFIDLMMVPDTQNLSNATVRFTITTQEGEQYRMGKLQVLAKKEIADKLRARWQLPEGAVFDRTYIERFVRENRSLLPPEFTADTVQLSGDCPAATVEVRLPVDANEAALHPAGKKVACEGAQE